MTENDFMEKMVDILDSEDELEMDMELKDLEGWDSLGLLTFLAEMEEFSNGPLKAENVKAAKTLADLYALIA